MMFVKTLNIRIFFTHPNKTKVNSYLDLVFSKVFANFHGHVPILWHMEVNMHSGMAQNLLDNLRFQKRERHFTYMSAFATNAFIRKLICMVLLHISHAQHSWTSNFVKVGEQPICLIKTFILWAFSTRRHFWWSQPHCYRL